MSTKKVIVSVPSQLMRNLLFARKPDIVWKQGVDDIISYAIYMEKERSNKKSLQSILKDLGIIGIDCSDMKSCYIDGKRIAESITCKSSYRINLNRLIELRDNERRYLSHDDAVCQLMYWALGSIQGNAEYQKTNDMFLLARMSGRDKPQKKDPSHPCKKQKGKKQKEESAELSQRQQLLATYNLPSHILEIGTRRKMQRYKKILAEKYHVSFYSKARGFYFSTKLNIEELTERAEDVKIKKPFKKRAP